MCCHQQSRKIRHLIPQYHLQLVLPMYQSHRKQCVTLSNKENLRNLIAATGLVISNWIHLNRQFFRPCDREIWWMTSKNNRALLLYYVKLCASFQIHWWIQTGFTVQNAQFGWKLVICYPCDLEIWWMTLENNRAPLLCYFKLSAAFRSHWWIQTGVTVRKRPIWVKFDDF